MLSPSMTVNEVLRQWPNTLSVIDRHGLDTCCGGNLSLATSAASAGTDLQRLLQELKQVVINQ